MIDVLVGFLGGEVALVGTEFQIESDAFLFRWNPDTSVDVKEGDGFQKPSGAAADAILKVSHRNGLIAYHCDIPGHSREFGQGLIDRFAARMRIQRVKA